MPSSTSTHPLPSTSFWRGWLALFVALLMLPSTAFPSDFVVTTTADSLDLNPGDGLCADSVGMCSLRAAIQEANAFAQADDIILPAGTYVLGIPGANEDFSATGDLDIRFNLNIEGSGRGATIIDANHLDRVFDIRSSASASMCRVSIRKGLVAGDGGGIRNFGKLKIMSTAIADNVSNGGGGIASLGPLSTLTIIQSAINSNSALREPSALSGATGGGIANGTGELQLDLTTISNNTVVGRGAGISNLGPVTIRNTTISNNLNLPLNEAEADPGGGLFNGPAGNGVVTDSTISGNTGYDGGGIANLGTLVLTNSTISGNVSPFVSTGPTSESGGHGGGLFNGPSAVLNILNSTIAENTAVASLGHGIDNRAVVKMRNTIMADNCSTLLASQPITSQGHNLHIDSSCGLSGPGDLAADPLLGALADNGGPTATHELLSGSPAIDTATACPVIDQRHFVRPFPCDRGAYEKGIEADLAVVKSVDCDSVKVGGELFFKLSAVNFGPISNGDVQLVDVLPSGLNLVAAEPSQGSCERPVPLRGGGTLLRCNLGSIPEDGTATVDVEVQAVEAGEKINTGTLTSPVLERQLANNVSRVKVRVRRGDR